MRAAPTLNDFLTFAVRRPVYVTDRVYINPSDLDGQELNARANQLFDLDATRVLNTALPFTVILKAASSPSLPLPLRQELLITAFTRGLMLHKDLGKATEELGRKTPGLNRFAAAYAAETTDEGRRFAAAFLLLHRPEAKPYLRLGIDRQTPPGELNEYRDNWWCQLESARQQFLDLHADPSGPESTLFPGRAAIDQTESELRTIARLPGAIEFLGSIVFAHQRLHPDDPRIPEALHDLVVHLHLACNMGGTPHTTKPFQRAFELLHSRYPKNIWTKRTPIWWT